jgi:hypothetical protein
VIWFKSNRQRTAEKAVEVVERALRQLDRERFADPLDRALVTQPRLAMLNKLLGRDREKAFEPVSFEEVASLTRTYADGGMILPLVKIINADPVLLGLFCAAMHENQLRNEMHALYEKRLGQRVKHGAQELIGLLNACSRSGSSCEPNERLDGT